MLCVDDKRYVNWEGWVSMIHIICVGGCVLNRDLGSFCDGHCEEVSV